MLEKFDANYQYQQASFSFFHKQQFDRWNVFLRREQKKEKAICCSMSGKTIRTWDDFFECYLHQVSEHVLLSKECDPNRKVTLFVRKVVSVMINRAKVIKTSNYRAFIKEITNIMVWNEYPSKPLTECSALSENSRLLIIIIIVVITITIILESCI